MMSSAWCCNKIHTFFCTLFATGIPTSVSILFSTCLCPNSCVEDALKCITHSPSLDILTHVAWRRKKVFWLVAGFMPSGDFSNLIV